MITVEEYKQLKAFARLDGAVLGVIMSVTFFAFVACLTNAAWQMAYVIGLVAVPVFVAYRVRIYRDKIVRKRVSFRRAAAYSMHCFGYSSLILSPWPLISEIIVVIPALANALINSSAIFKTCSVDKSFFEEYVPLLYKQ